MGSSGLVGSGLGSSGFDGNCLGSSGLVGSGYGLSDDSLCRCGLDCMRSSWSRRCLMTLCNQLGGGVEMMRLLAEYLSRRMGQLIWLLGSWRRSCSSGVGGGRSLNTFDDLVWRSRWLVFGRFRLTMRMRRTYRAFNLFIYCFSSWTALYHWIRRIHNHRLSRFVLVVSFRYICFLGFLTISCII